MASEIESKIWYDLVHAKNGDEYLCLYLLRTEVKSRIAGNTSGMEAFKNQYNPHKVLLVGKSGLSWDEFLTINPATLF